MYAKLFSSLYQGTLRGRSAEILVFTNLLAHCDKEGYVDKHFRAIADETGISVDDVKSAIVTLEAPDDESRSPECEGRRIIRIDDHRLWGWQVVNFEKYRGVRDEESRRETWRNSQRKRRSRMKTEKPTPDPDVNTGQHCQHPSTPVPPCPASSTQAEAYTEAEAELEPPLSGEIPLTGNGEGEKDLLGDTVNPPPAAKPRCLPEGWKKLSEKQKSQKRVNFNNSRMLQIGKAFGRKDSTLWTIAEAEGLLTVNPTSEEIDMIVRFYQADIPEETDRRRNGLQTLLNNWSGELDKARVFFAKKNR